MNTERILRNLCGLEVLCSQVAAVIRLIMGNNELTHCRNLWLAVLLRYSGWRKLTLGFWWIQIRSLWTDFPNRVTLAQSNDVICIMCINTGVVLYCNRRMTVSTPNLGVDYMVTGRIVNPPVLACLNTGTDWLFHSTLIGWLRIHQFGIVRCEIWEISEFHIAS